MDISLVLGLIIGVVAVGTGLLMKGASVSILFSPEAIMVILAGTMAAVMNSFPQKEFMNLPRLFGAVFRKKKNEDPVELIKIITDLAQMSRRNGLLSLEAKIKEIDNDFMKHGLEMVIDGIDMQYIREVLSDEIEAMEERHRSGALVFTTAGSSSPTLGVLGAVIGLIGALGNLNDTQKLGESIASAFVATLYGIFLGYVVWHPFATRLKRKSHDEIASMAIMLEGIIAVQEGRSPKSIEQKLKSMLRPEDRKRLVEVNNNDNNRGV